MIDKEFAISYLLDYCDDCPENKDGECLTESHCFEVKQMAIKAIRQMIPEDATNGDVIKAIFPKAKVWESSGKICVDGHGCFKTFSIDWWNAPYKGGH